MKFEQDPPGRVKLKHLISAALNLLILSSRISHERDPVHVQCGLVVSWSCGLMDSAQSTQLNPDYSQLAAAEPFPHQPQPAHGWGAAKVTVLGLRAPLTMLVDTKGGIPLPQQQFEHLHSAGCFQSLQSVQRDGQG